MAQEQGPGQEYAKKYGQIVAQAWMDPAFKQRLLVNPAAVLEEHGIEVPAGREVKVVGDIDHVGIFALPAKPGEVSDEQLAEAVSLGGGTGPYSEIVAKAWADEAFKRQLLANPAAVLREHGIEVPADKSWEVIELQPNQLPFVLPPRPAEGQLSDEQLAQVAGGLYDVEEGYRYPYEDYRAPSGFWCAYKYCY